MVKTEITGAEARTGLCATLKPYFSVRIWMSYVLLDYFFRLQIAEEMEKERRMFQLQMCEVRGQSLCFEESSSTGLNM